MTKNATSGQGPFFWIAVLGAVGLALFLIIKFLFPQVIEKFTTLLVGLFIVATGLIFRKKR